MKKIYKVRPRVHLVKDENGNTIRSDYNYAPAPSCKCDVLVYNRDSSPPEGDFLQEQMWVVDGPEESHAIFSADPGVTEITHAECCQLGPQWDGPKETEDRVTPGARVVCPDCGTELACPDCGPMAGKTPKMMRQHRGFHVDDHAHHFADLDEHKHSKP